MLDYTKYQNLLALPEAAWLLSLSPFYVSTWTKQVWDNYVDWEMKKESKFIVIAWCEN